MNTALVSCECRMEQGASSKFLSTYPVSKAWLGCVAFILCIVQQQQWGPLLGKLVVICRHLQGSIQFLQRPDYGTSGNMISLVSFRSLGGINLTHPHLSIWCFYLTSWLTGYISQSSYVAFFTMIAPVTQAQKLTTYCLVFKLETT